MFMAANCLPGVPHGTPDQSAIPLRTTLVIVIVLAFAGALLQQGTDPVVAIAVTTAALQLVRRFTR
jgi:hypothetical protein